MSGQKSSVVVHMLREANPFHPEASSISCGFAMDFKSANWIVEHCVMVQNGAFTGSVQAFQPSIPPVLNHV